MRFFYQTNKSRGTAASLRYPIQQRLGGVELLENRLVLAVDMGSLDRPPLNQTDSVYLENSQIGPPPIVMSKSEIIGDKTNSFIITAVANGVVEKWIPSTNSWANVSAPVSTSNTNELIKLLNLRLIQQGDRIQWKPDESTNLPNFQNAFVIIGWDDGLPQNPPSSEAPKMVQDLRFGQSEGPNSLTVAWDVPESLGNSSNYTITIDNGATSTTYVTTSTSKQFSDLQTGVTYTFWVWATNEHGTGPSSTISGAPSKDQTPSFSTVSQWSRDYTLSFSEYEMGAADVPTLQSFASALHNDQWILLAGRTNGLHGFSGDGIENFPPKYQNTDVWVIDPVTKESWSRSLEDPSSGLNQSIIASLSATNTQSYQDGNTLFIVGGYVFDWTTYQFTTYNALSALDLPSLVNWVKSTDTSLASNAILQTPGDASTDESYYGGFFAVTGGGLERVSQHDDRYQLIFGQNFEGGYTPGSNGVYTSQIRSFDITYDMTSGTLAYDNETVSPFGGDPTSFRRRDLNVFPIIAPDGQGGITESTVALAGVFYNGEGVWTVPVEIGPDGIPATDNPTTDSGAFKQAMNQYESGKIGLFSQSSGEMTEVLLGGISANTFDPNSGQLSYDDNYGFNRQITAVLRDASGNYQQQYIADFPDIYDGNASLLYFGANARFFPAPGINVFSNDIINVDALTTETVLGHMFGGIAADQPNFGNTVASSFIFEVRYIPPSS